MKIAPQANRKLLTPPPIPFEAPEVKELKKTDVLLLELKTSPTEVESKTHKMHARILKESVSCEDVLLWVRDMKTINAGLELKEPRDKFNMTKKLLQGDCLTAFSNYEQGITNVTDASYERALKALVDHVFPRRALHHQKQYMRRFMRKPFDTKSKDFVARVQQLNDYLNMFPPFKNNQMLPEDELLDILEFSIPATWQKEFIRSGFDPVEHDVKTFVEHCERMELTEALEKPSSIKDKGLNATSKKNSGHLKAGKSQAKPSEEAKKHHNKPFCDLHQQYGHSTADCKVVQGQINKMRAAWSAKSPESKIEDRKRARIDKKEFHTLFKEYLTSYKSESKNKKRKTEMVNHLSESDEDSI